jgi:acyl-CoA thioesterase FadM
VTAIGRSSVDLATAASAGGAPRFEVRSRAVFTRLDTRKSISIPDELRSAIAPYVSET